MHAEIIARLETSFLPFADPQAVHKAYESGRRDALLARQIEPSDSVDFRDEAELDAKVLFESLPPKAQKSALSILKALANFMDEQTARSKPDTPSSD